MGASTAQLRAWWAPACKFAGVTLSLHGTGRVHVDRRCADAVRALNACLVRWDYRTRKGDTGAFSCRPITGGDDWSLHAYGIALDLNWLSNPYGRKLVTDMPAGMVGAILAIKTKAGLQVFRWGGHYSKNKDGMHFEVVLSPAQLAAGIDWRTVPTATVAWAPEAGPSGIPRTVLRQGATGKDVSRIQWTLNVLRPITGLPHLVITNPAGWGGRTTEAVHRFQVFARAMQQLAGETDEAVLIDVDDTWGPQTGAAAEFWCAVQAAGK